MYRPLATVSDMSDVPPCPACGSVFAYLDRQSYVCPKCGNEWGTATDSVNVLVVVDVNGKPLASGDTVSVVKDLKIKGASGVIKAGTKVKNIRVLDADHIVDGHDIDCKIAGFGVIKLKGSVVRKV